MQTITPELEAILVSKFQAGASGFRARFEVVGGATLYPTSMGVDHSLQTMADALTAEFDNEDGTVGLATTTFPINALIRAYAWYGAEANAVQVFEGFIDKVSEHRDPRTVTVLCRDWAKPLLVQNILVRFPQGANEPGAVRTMGNLVFLNMDVSDIVGVLLNIAGYPAAKRAIQPTNFVVEEWLGTDGASYADAIGELADLVAYNAFADELGVFHFQPDGLADSDTDTPPTPVYTFMAGVDLVYLDPQRDDYDTKTRVRAVGPYTTLKDAWTELWHSNVIKNPTGVRYDPADPTHLFVADGPLKKVYRITQGADAAIVGTSPVLVTTYLNGLSGDPSDATVYWTFDTPWIVTGVTTLNKIRKHLKSDDSVLATFTLANQQWTDMKVGDDAIWVTNFSTNKIHRLSKVDGSEIGSYGVTYNGIAQIRPIGVALDGDALYMAFYGQARMLVGTTTDPSDITRELAFSGTQSLGGDIDTTTHTELYACSGGLSLVYKYTLKEPVTTDVSVEVANTALEAALGIELDTGAEIRRLILNLKVITSHAQATEAAARWLDKLDQFRNVLDAGIIGNPALQKGDMVRVIDPISEIEADFQIDTYRSQIDASRTYLGTLALVPWTSSYGGPGITAAEVVIATSTAWKVALTGTPPAGWHDVGFDDSAYANPVNPSQAAWYDSASPYWIWDSALAQEGDGVEESFRHEFEITGIVASAELLVSADNGCEVYLNGTLVATVGGDERGSIDVAPFNYADAMCFDVPGVLNAGTNCISIIAWNENRPVNDSGPAGVYAVLTVHTVSNL